MKTRSSVDLSKLDIKDLLLTTKEDSNFNYIRKQYNNTKTNNTQNNRIHINSKRHNHNHNDQQNDSRDNHETRDNHDSRDNHESHDNHESRDQYEQHESNEHSFVEFESNENDTITWFLFDVEAYSLDKLPNNNANSVNVIPVQIAWTICTYSFEHNNTIQESQEIEQLERLTNIHTLEIPQEIKNKCRLIKQEKKMFYVSESLLLSKYRNLLTNFSSYFSHATLQKHEQNLILSKFPIRPANRILSEMSKDIKKANFITAFNMEWDIKAIDNLCKIATTPPTSTPVGDQKNQKKKNPLLTKELRKKHVDLMIISYKLFWNQLHPNDQTNNNQKGKYTVETMHKTLCNTLGTFPIEQKHLAEFDVDMELDILTAVLNNFENPNALESYVTRRKKGSLTVPYWNKKRKF